MSPATHADSPLKRLRVLYVEDEEDAREQFAQFLKRIAGDLVTAKDGQEGLAAYHAHRPHIIITDIQMPTMDGLAMASIIRKLDKSTRIIVLTAYEQLDYLKGSINVGVDKYLTKPVDGRQLQATLLECADAILAEEALKSAAASDPLTGLLNRRELESRFLAEKSASERHGDPLALIMVDIDHFKEVNDTYGHVVGDQVLKGVARTMRSSLRAEDICGRWGGEEFLILLPRTDLAAAAVVAEKLRLAVCALVTEWAGKTIAVTISLGVGESYWGVSMDDSLATVDQALYRAKQNGRNRHATTSSLNQA